MGFFVGLVLFVGVCGDLDSMLPLAFGQATAAVITGHFGLAELRASQPFRHDAGAASAALAPTAHPARVL